MATPAYSQGATVLHWTGSGVTSDTKAFTGATGDTMLVVFVVTNQAQNVTGITYDGNAMTLVDSLSPGGNNKCFCYAYSGTIANSSKNIVTSFSASIGFYDIAIATFSGSSTTIPTNKVKNSTNSNTKNFSNNALTVANASSLVIGCVAEGSDGGTVSSTSSATKRVSASSGMVGEIYTIAPGAGSYTDSWTFSGTGNNWGAITFELPPPTVTNPAFLLNFM